MEPRRHRLVRCNEFGGPATNRARRFNHGHVRKCFQFMRRILRSPLGLSTGKKSFQLPGCAPNEGRTWPGGSLTCRLRPAPKASIPVTRRTGFLGARKLLEPANQEVRPTLGSPHSEMRPGQIGRESCHRQCRPSLVKFRPS